MFNSKMIGTNNSSGGAVPLSFNIITYGFRSDGIRTGVGFQPDMIWGFNTRFDGYTRHIYDSVRGTRQAVFPMLSNAQTYYSNGVTSFDADGYTTGNNVALNSNYICAFCFKGGNGSVINNQGTIQSEVSANPDAGFSIIEYTYDGTNPTKRVGTGLNQPVELIIEKRVNGSEPWSVIANVGSGFEIANPRSLDPFSTNFTDWDGANAPDNTTYKSIRNQSDTYVSYCFHSVEGYSKVGTYEGNGGNQSIDMGFEPAFFLVKNVDATGAWYIVNNKRVGMELDITTINKDVANADAPLFSSTGVNLFNGRHNNNGNTFVYVAIANQFTE